MHLNLQRHALPLLLILLAISILSLLPVAGLPEKAGFTDKQSHFIAYGSAALAGFCLIPRADWRLFLLLVLWGIGIEVAQHMIPNRLFNGMDVVANTLGALLGWGLALPIRRLRFGKRQQQ